MLYGHVENHSTLLFLIKRITVLYRCKTQFYLTLEERFVVYHSFGNLLDKNENIIVFYQSFFYLFHSELM